MKYFSLAKISSLQSVAKKVFSLLMSFTILSLNSVPAFADAVINSNYVGVYYLDNQTGSIANIDVTTSYVNLNHYYDSSYKWNLSGTNGVGRVGSGSNGFYVLFDSVSRVMIDGTYGTTINSYIASGDVEVGLFFSKVTIYSNQSRSNYVKD